MTTTATTAPIIRSDTLPELRRVLEKLLELRQYLGDILQVVLVLDASCVQRELRWRVGPRKNPAARTYLHEAMVSGVVVAFAPSFLEVEIQKYIPEIAKEKGVSVDRIQEEWKQFKVLIQFFDPAPSKQLDNSVDPKDVDYLNVLDQVDGDFVYTSDSDFSKMGARVMPAGLDRVLRDYARATSVILTVKLGSGFAMVVGGHVIYALAALIADFFRVGITGAREQRPELERLLAECSKRRVDAVVVYRYDRFARSLRQLVNALEEFRALGIEFVSLHEGVDTSAPNGRLVFGIFASIAEFERELICERVRSGLAAARARGKRIGRPRKTVDAAKIARLRASGASWRTIAAQLGVSGRDGLQRGARPFKERLV